MLYINIYIIGCMLAYGRLLAACCDAAKEPPTIILDWFASALTVPEERGEVLRAIRYATITILASWFGFLAGIIVYYQRKQKRFIRF